MMFSVPLAFSYALFGKTDVNGGKIPNTLDVEYYIEGWTSTARPFVGSTYSSVVVVDS